MIFYLEKEKIGSHIITGLGNLSLYSVSLVDEVQRRCVVFSETGRLVELPGGLSHGRLQGSKRLSNSLSDSPGAVKTINFLIEPFARRVSRDNGLSRSVRGIFIDLFNKLVDKYRREVQEG
jgi:hypothetical protein